MARASVSIHCQHSRMDHRRSGAQPWIIHGPDATQRRSFIDVRRNAWFTILGFIGMYTILGIRFIFSSTDEIEAAQNRGASREHDVMFSAGE